MARAHSLWVVLDEDGPVAGFTVKHEMIAWINRQGPAQEVLDFVEIWKMPDNPRWADSPKPTQMHIFVYDGDDPDHAVLKDVTSR